MWCILIVTFSPQYVTLGNSFKHDQENAFLQFQKKARYLIISGFKYITLDIPYAHLKPTLSNSLAFFH